MHVAIESPFEQAEADYAALHDEETGFPGAVLFLDRVEAAVRMARRDQAGLGVVLLDVDGLDAVREDLGEDIAEVAFVKLVRAMGTGLRAGDTVARVGATTFGFVLPRVQSEHTARLVIEKLVGGVSEELVAVGIEVRLHIGAAYAGPLDPLPRETLVAAARRDLEASY